MPSTFRIPKADLTGLYGAVVRRVSKNACATIGVASNIHHHYRQLGKAGRSRWLGIRPTVRGVAMNKGTSLSMVLNLVLLAAMTNV